MLKVTVFSRRLWASCISVLALGMLAACEPAPGDVIPEESLSESASVSADPFAITGTGGFVWPASLPVFGDPFPQPGSTCRRVGEAPATINYLDDSAILIGCPGSADGAEMQAILTHLKGRVVGHQEGVTLITVPTPTAAQAAPLPSPGTQSGVQAAASSGNAKGTLPCARLPGQPTTPCDYTVIRNPDRTAVVTVNWPGGGSRKLFFNRNGLLTSTDAVSGGAKTPFMTRKDVDLNFISIGDERYEVVDAIPMGG